MKELLLALTSTTSLVLALLLFFQERLPSSLLHPLQLGSYTAEAEILVKNPDKSLKSFPESPLQLCTEISISSNSRNLLQFLECVTVHCKGERRKT